MFKRIIVVLVFLPGMAAADKLFECYYDESQKTVVTALIEEGTTQYGSITVSGETNKAIYEVKDFLRMWYFPLGEGGEKLKYGFAIDAKGFGYYFDFTNKKVGEAAYTSLAFTCKKSVHSKLMPYMLE